MTRLRSIVLGTTLLFTAGSAAALGQLGESGYPAADCGPRPITPARPEKFKTEEALRRFNLAVEGYNGAMEGWIDCLQGYVDGAAADIERIRARIDEALELADER